MTTVETWLLAECDGRETTPVFVSYDPRLDPLALRWLFPNDVVWYVDRQLLDAGSRSAAGEPDADVQVWPEGRRHVAIRLSSPEGQTTFRVARDALAELVRASYRLVPRRNEADYLNLDGLIGQLLKDASW